MKKMIPLILTALLSTQSVFAFESTSVVSDAFTGVQEQKNSPEQMTWSLTLAPFYPLSITGFGICAGLLKLSGHYGEMDGLICIAMLIPGLNLTVSGNLSAEATTYQSQYNAELQRRKEIIIGAQESAAIFVANNGLTEIDPTLLAALEIFNIPEAANLNHVEKARLVLMAPGVF